MKFLRLFIIVLTAGFIFSSCQKEFSAEAGNAHGSLKSNATGDCTPAIKGGTFKKDTLLKTSNYADIQVNITQTGTYYIKTDTVNGYSFSAAGAVAVTGTNTIRLLASGKPITPGVDLFTIKFDTSQCEFDVTVTGAGGGGGGAAAVFTLTGSPTSCTGATQTTNFYATIPTTPANTVTVNADVTVAGTYSITASTTPSNNLTFTGTGTLAVGTNQPIVLVADGNAPSGMGSIPYTLATTSPASNCGFNLTVQAAPSPATFSFDCSAPSYTGTYQQNVSTAGNTVTISVISIAGGSYNITSTYSNNVTFGGAGVLSASPTPQPVTLFASGTPTAAGPFTYTLTGGSGATGTCTINQTYTGAPTVTGFLTASINGAPVTTFNVNITVDTTPFLGSPNIDVSGDNNATGIESFGFGVTSPAGVTTGTPYSVNSTSAFVNGDYTDATGNSFSANNAMQPTPFFTVIFSVKTNNHIVGTFSGQLQDAGGGAATIAITNGQFDINF